VMGWIKIVNSNSEVILSKENDVGGYALGVYTNSSKTIALNVAGTGTTNIVTSTQALSLDVFTLVVFTRKDGVGNVYLNGNFDNSNAIVTSASGSNPLYVGLKWGLVGPFSGGLSLLRMGKGSPDSAQIKEIYDAERPLFQPDAKCTLQGTSSDVKALDYDESTGLLTVCSANHTTKLNGLMVASDEPIVSSSISTVSGKEVYGI